MALLNNIATSQNFYGQRKEGKTGNCPFKPMARRTRTTPNDSRRN